MTIIKALFQAVEKRAKLALFVQLGFSYEFRYLLLELIKEIDHNAISFNSNTRWPFGNETLRNP